MFRNKPRAAKILLDIATLTAMFMTVAQAIKG
jgi:hypothetical protein